MTKHKAVKVIGAGLAGCEATWQLVKRGIPVHLYEMRPKKMTPAQIEEAEVFAEDWAKSHPPLSYFVPVYGY